MLGNNPIRSAEFGDGNELFVKEVFATFQGECYLAGVPAVFVRLGGCNLACDFCDTNFEDYTKTTLENLLQQVDNLSKNSSGKRVRNLVVITGGEPFRQPIENLCEQLINQNYKVQIETNGTLYRKINTQVQIVCSPKNPNGTKPQIRGDILERCNALKFIISATKPNYNNVWNVVEQGLNIPIYVQPMDELNVEKNKQNVEYVKKLAFENGYNISIQTHKILEIA
jgi:7-carboxy-7-deazaguanine synthase